MKIYVEINAVCNKKNRYRSISEKSENVIVYVKICWLIGCTCALKGTYWKVYCDSISMQFKQLIKQLSFSSFFNKSSLQLFKIYEVICILYFIFIVNFKETNYSNFRRPVFKVIQYFISSNLLLGAVFSKQDIYPQYSQMLSRFWNLHVFFLLIVYLHV